MPSNVTRNFAAAGGMANVDCVLQVELFGKSREIISVGVHLVAIPRLRGTTMPSAVMRDNSITTLAKEHHLSVPIVGTERPPMTEYDGLPFAPILVENRRSIFCADRRHIFFSSSFASGGFPRNVGMRNSPAAGRGA